MYEEYCILDSVNSKQYVKRFMQKTLPILVTTETIKQLAHCPKEAVFKVLTAVIEKKCSLKDAGTKVKKLNMLNGVESQVVSLIDEAKSIENVRELYPGSVSYTHLTLPTKRIV